MKTHEKNHQAVKP